MTPTPDLNVRLREIVEVVNLLIFFANFLHHHLLAELKASLYCIGAFETQICIFTLDSN